MGEESRLGKAWRHIAQVGVDGAPPSAARAVRGANSFFALGALVAIPWMVALAFHKSTYQPYPGITHALLILVWGACLWLNSRGLRLLAPSIGLLAALAQYTYLVHLYGRDAGFHLLLLAVPTVAFVVFDSFRLAMRITAGLVAGVMTGWVMIDPRFDTPVVASSDLWLSTIAVANVASALLIFIVVALYSDLYLRKERARADALLAEAQRAADTDYLTGALNRRGIASELDAAASAGSHAIILVDVDRFKHVNDVMGHSAGDDVLAGVARTLTEVLGSRGTLARWGGEEFIVTAGARDRDDATALAEELRREVEEHFAATEGAPAVTVSAGVAFAAQPVSLALALRVADSCLYAAKESGRNLVVVRDVRDQRAGGAT